jgi:quercetin dioxygenase-like cupin family protein
MPKWSFARCGLAAAALVGAPTAPAPAAAQDAPVRPVRVVMASSKLVVAPDAPLQFRLLQGALPAERLATLPSADGFVFVASGSVELVSGAQRQALGEGEARFVGAGATAIHAAGGKGATWLHYLIGTKAALERVAYPAPATSTELYRGEGPLPLGAGPHELSLTRVTVPPGAPTPPMHHRSGAALYRVLSGSGLMHLQGREEPRASGAVQYEPNGFIHTWENTGRTPLVLLQANVSAEGAPEIIWLK